MQDKRIFSKVDLNNTKNSKISVKKKGDRNLLTYVFFILIICFLSTFIYYQKQNSLLNDRQLDYIQKLARNCQSTQTCYSKLHKNFDIPSFYRLKMKDYDEAVRLLKSHKK